MKAVMTENEDIKAPLVSIIKVEPEEFQSVVEDQNYKRLSDERVKGNM